MSDFSAFYIIQDKADDRELCRKREFFDEATGSEIRQRLRRVGVAEVAESDLFTEMNWTVPISQDTGTIEVRVSFRNSRVDDLCVAAIISRFSGARSCLRLTFRMSTISLLPLQTIWSAHAK